MSIFQNTCKPEGLGGKLMVNMMNKGHAAMAAWGFEHINVSQDSYCLDIGCGGGANVKKLLEKAPEGKVTGVDYSPVSVEKTEKVNRAAIQAGRCQVFEGNVMNLDFPEHSFDLATAFETIYFWPDISKAFREVFRVLRPGGVFMVCNESDGYNPSDEKWTQIIDGMRVYRAEEIREAMTGAGFTDVSVDQNEKHWLCLVGHKEK